MEHRTHGEWERLKQGTEGHSADTKHRWMRQGEQNWTFSTGNGTQAIKQQMTNTETWIKIYNTKKGKQTQTGVF